jgi:hypothetical protein
MTGNAQFRRKLLVAVLLLSLRAVPQNVVITPSGNQNIVQPGYKNLTVWVFPTANTANLEVCNQSASIVRPTALTFTVKAF